MDSIIAKIAVINADIVMMPFALMNTLEAPLAAVRFSGDWIGGMEKCETHCTPPRGIAHRLSENMRSLNMIVKIAFISYPNLNFASVTICFKYLQVNDLGIIFVNYSV